IRIEKIEDDAIIRDARVAELKRALEWLRGGAIDEWLERLPLAAHPELHFIIELIERPHLHVELKGQTLVRDDLAEVRGAISTRTARNLVLDRPGVAVIRGVVQSSVRIIPRAVHVGTYEISICTTRYDQLESLVGACGRAVDALRERPCLTVRRVRKSEIRD